jgi:TolB protein
MDEGGRWSPDGTRILFTSNRDGNLEVYRMNCDGSNPVRMTDNPLQDCCAQWSPDGQTIVFVTSGNGEDIWLMNADGSNMRSLVTNAVNDFVPCWSPDGNSIAFQTAFDNNNDEITIFDIDTGQQTRLTFRNGIDTFPSWKDNE